MQGRVEVFASVRMSCYANRMTIDERLEFLRQSTESLHASCQELHATAVEHTEEMRRLTEESKRLDDRERRGRQAILAAITAYLDGLNGNGAEEDGET